ncbi:GNAT family N-acetyltransferase [Streptomyces sp. A7024]|uniref:GNAT family N-acetyltransferase n=1 Tax=Streptomyces coryli TaxID=1128680 RepID=A0A6G4TUB8_9ACTN|nr:GNAT family protein [Streptomyces coryli]NGN63056.1 GNAT family N-acetyltransferase [Streptomyces coryli]
MTSEIALRPAREEDVSLIQEHINDPEQCGEFSWFGWTSGLRMTERWKENRLLGDDYSILMVVRGEERLGFVNYRRRPLPPSGHSWVLGIGMFPEARGFGYGTEAHRLLVRYLFANTTVHRIEAETDVKNLAEQRALEKAGFSREGVTRAACFRDGAWRDGVTYSILRTDPLP